MRVTRLFVKIDHLENNQRISLPLSSVHYLAQVLRLKKGHQVYVFNGLGLAGYALIENIGKKQIELNITQLVVAKPMPKLNIHLGQVINKGQKMDWVIQKSVELGVSEITPLLSERCVIKLDLSQTEKKMAHWQNIIIDACEQCERDIMPILHPPTQLKQWLRSKPFELGLCMNPHAGQTLKDQQIPDRIGFLVGPEGGLSGIEIDLCLQANFINIVLGPRILRTETAALAGIAALQTLAGDY